MANPLEFAKKKPFTIGAIVIGGALVVYLMYAGRGNSSAGSNSSGQPQVPYELLAMQVQADTTLALAGLEAQTQLAGKQADISLAQFMVQSQMVMAEREFQHEANLLEDQIAGSIALAEIGSSQAIALGNIERLAFSQQQQTERQISKDQASVAKTQAFWGGLGNALGGVGSVLGAIF